MTAPPPRGSVAAAGAGLPSAILSIRPGAVAGQLPSAPASLRTPWRLLPFPVAHPSWGSWLRLCSIPDVASAAAHSPVSVSTLVNSRACLAAT